MSLKDFDPEKIKIILATDIGSTTSKAILIRKIGDEYRLVTRAEAPTTVEAPLEDVRIGVRNAVMELGELSGMDLLDEEGIRMRKNESDRGVDIYVSTSSAGGGLQMICTGLIPTMTAESARRAALGAGAIVMETFTAEDKLEDYEKVRKIRQLRPDMILFAGGVDGGNTKLVYDTAELIKLADPRPRLGISFHLPVVYAGNKDAREKVKGILSDKFSLQIAANIRPDIHVEDVEEARNAVHELYLEHVMAHAPGYPDVMKWTSIPIMPTPLAFGRMIEILAEHFKINAIGTDPGGATTDIFSVFEGKFVRTVSANLGLSYSICNVLKEAGIENIMRWIPLNLEEAYVRDVLRNKMIYPTTIPQNNSSLMIEQAVNREGMRLAFEHHKLLARGLRGLMREPGHALDEDEIGTYIKMMQVSMLLGSGGANAHAPRRAQTASMLMDAFQPEGVTQLYVDSIFMVPHLGVLYGAHPKASLDVLLKDCLILLGTCIVPVIEGRGRGDAVKVTVKMPDGGTVEESVSYGAMKRIPIGETETVEVEINPYGKFDVGGGPGETVNTTIVGGIVGLVIDARGRPLILPEGKEERDKKLIEWFTAIGAYSADSFSL